VTLAPTQVSPSDIINAVFTNPSPVVGGILGGMLSGGLFGCILGWMSHVRGIRPILVFFRDENEEAPKWKVRNIGTGPAMHIRIRDYDSKNLVTRRVRPYALQSGRERPLDWVTAGSRLEADYSDVYGRRWYRSVATENETVFARRFRSFWRRPSTSEIREYEPEIHVLRSLGKR
jgi:hypothetical protein